ncbi:radial spoke head protein 9 homolog [Diretmus argenteus]
MDSGSLYYSLDLVAGSRSTLSPEQRAALQTSLVLLEKNTRFHRVLFWGRILGQRADYFIAQGKKKDEMDKVHLYSFDCVDWHLLPPVTESMIVDVSKAAKGLFMGDPSHVYKHEGDDASEEEVQDQIRVTEVTEKMRLAVTVRQIDEEASVVPRGAFIKSPRGMVKTNRSFGGLSHSEAGKLHNFLHFTEPTNLYKKSIMETAALNASIDFLDPLSDDIPKGSWSLQFEHGSNVCVIRSLLWLGLTFFHVPATVQHGYVYIGHGCKNLDLPFMI